MLPLRHVVVRLQAMDETFDEAHVRTAEPRDTDAVDRLILYLDEFHTEARPDLFRVPPQRPRGDRFLISALEDAEQQVLVAVRDDDVVGYTHVIIKRTPVSDHRIDRRYAEIETIAVFPTAQRRGVGRKLIDAALDWARSKGVDDHQIAVHEFNFDARKLYEQLGFTPSVILFRRKD